MVNEARTRKEKIDPILKQSGWNMDDLSQVIVEIDTKQSDFVKRDYKTFEETFVNNEEKAYADYLLLDSNGDPLAIIEAKKTSKDPITGQKQAAVYALDIKQGDEVLIPSFTFVATANSVYSTGAKPVFVDILKENFTMDPDDLQKKITKKYFDEILSENKMPFDKECSYHFYWIRVKNRTKFRKTLSQKGIETGIHYKPIHTFSFYKSKTKLPITEKVGREIVILPTHPNLTQNDVEKIIKEVNKLS